MKRNGGKGKFPRSLRKRFSKESSSANDSVEVCELGTEDKKQKRSRAKLGEALDSGQSGLAATPLGVPPYKRSRRYGGHQVSPLNLSPPVKHPIKTEVTVIDASFLDDSPNSSSQGETDHSNLNSSSSLIESDTSKSSFCSDEGELMSSTEGGDSPDGPVSPVEPVEMDGLSEDSDVVSSYRIIDVKEAASSSFLLLMPYGGKKLPVRGRARIRSLYGTVTVHGYDITPESSKPTEIYCPNNVGFLCLETRPCEGKELKSKEKSALKVRLAALKPTVDPVAQMTSESVLLQISHLSHKASKFITSFACNSHLYTGGRAKKALQKPEISICDKVGLFLQPDEAGSKSVIQPSQDYITAAESVSEAVRSNQEPPIVIFVGPKNSGKSTAERFMINKMKAGSSDVKVCYLECDPGQCEFTAPAILSLHVITHPLLGPPFTHLQEAEKAYFLGDVNVADHADRYLKIIAALYQHYQANFSHLPLFINTMGWVEGLGLKLLREVARITRPTHEVQLVAGDGRLVPVFAGADHQQDDCFSVSAPTDQLLLPPKQTLVIEADCQSDRYQAAPQRELNLLASLSRLLTLNNPPHTKSVYSIPPLRVPWQSVVLHVCHGELPASQVLSVVNARIVALCSTSQEELERCNVHESVEGVRTLKSTPVSECVGIGIIRAIDIKKKLYYILPAVPREALTRVNTLLVGGPSIPECLLMQICSRNEEVPYLSQYYDTNIPGSLPIMPKTYLKKGGLGGGGGGVGGGK